MDESESVTGGPLSPVLSELDGLVDHLEGVRARAANAFAAETYFFANVAKLIERRERERAARRTDGVVVDATQLGMREVYAELAAALHLSEYQIAARVSSASVLMRRFHETLCEVSDGRLSPQHATAIADVGTVIDDDGVRAEYERHALEIAGELTPAQLRDALEGLVSRLDPEGTRERIREAVARRQVRVRQVEPGLSRLTLDLPTAQAVGGYRRLHDMASELAAQGREPASPGDGPSDERTHSQLMADIATDLLLTSVPEGHGATEQARTALGAIRPTVHITIPSGVLTDTTTACPTDTTGTVSATDSTDPGADTAPIAAAELAGGTFGGIAPARGACAEIPGFGVVDDETARRIAAQADTWMRVFTDPSTGVPDCVDRYRPSTAQRQLIQARDLTCRFPGCRRPAQKCDIDHTIAAAEGGPTALCNLACLCARHHTLKHQTDWGLEQLAGGILSWTSPTRRTHRTRPPGAVRFVAEHSPPAHRPGDPPRQRRGHPPGHAPAHRSTDTREVQRDPDEPAAPF